MLKKLFGDMVAKVEGEVAKRLVDKARRDLEEKIFGSDDGEEDEKRDEAEQAEREARERAREEREARERAEREKKAAAEAIEAAKRREREVDDELAALKKKLGKK